MFSTGPKTKGSRYKEQQNFVKNVLSSNFDTENVRKPEENTTDTYGATVRDKQEVRCFQLCDSTEDV